MPKFYVTTGKSNGTVRELREVVIADSPEDAIKMAFKRAFQCHGEVIVGSFIIVSEFGFQDDELDPMSIAFLFDDISQAKWTMSP